MNIPVPSEEEYQKQKQYKRRNFIGGLMTGLILFGIAGISVFRYGMEHVAWYTWLALGFGVLSFGLMAMHFGSEFWQRLSGNN